MNAIEQILIVEDDPTIRCILEMALKADGYTHVTSAARGDEGLDLARRLRPDLVLLDLMLPGLDGFTVASGVHAKAYNPAIVSVPLKLDDTITVGIIRRSGIPPSPAAEAFVAAMRRIIASSGKRA